MIELISSGPIHDFFDVWCSVVAFNTPPSEIERLAATLSKVPAKIALTIIDNSTDLARSLPSSFDLPDNLAVFIVRTSRNLGYGRAHNLAIEQSINRCRYHVVLNSDIVFQPEVISKLIAFMDGRPTAGLVMPMVRYPEGAVQHLCRLLPNPMVLIGRRFFGSMAWTKKMNRRYEFHD